LKSWDIAAGMLIVAEAGGFVEAIRPDERALESGDLIAGNAGVFDRFKTVIRNA
jgi:myo-inositol-1(or 4)-monophosphatase